MTPWSELLVKFLGLEDVESLSEVRLSFAASWAREAPAWILFACLGCAALSFLAYSRARRPASRLIRSLLAATRTAALAIVVLALAEPVVTAHLERAVRPLLWLVFDGSESMAIQDTVETEGPTRTRKARIDSIREELGRAGGFCDRLASRSRLRAFTFDRPDGVRPLDWTMEPGDSTGGARLASLLSATGQTTAIGSALEDLARRQGASPPAAIVLFSDFNQNAGPPLLDAARRLGIPVHAVGVGPTAPPDLLVELESPLLVKRSERAILNVRLRPVHLAGRTTRLQVQVHSLGQGDTPSSGSEDLTIADQTVELGDEPRTIQLTHVPQATGRLLVRAVADALPGEDIVDNNTASREITVRDDFLRALFVEYEPNWEWRFLKEVFHRDQLVGMRGFRTYLRSADPRVRQSNELFLPTLTPPRGEFFANDVVFLGDVPAQALSARFCELLKELVSRFGGGLVILSGPRFGPAQLAGTPLVDLLPVVPDPSGRAIDSPAFQPVLTPEGRLEDFLRLGDDAAEDQRAWAGLSSLVWYQPSLRLHPLGVALAVHPRDMCADGKTPQPLIAHRRYGSGEVVYLAFNETWRLRKSYGERYYRRFWGQLIHRLGLSHALGEQKRFVVRTDRRQYLPDEPVTVSVEAYDANFEPLKPTALPGHQLGADLLGPRSGPEESAQQLLLSSVKDGLYQAQFAALESGEHHVRVRDPITGGVAEATFQVSSVSVERRSVARDTALAAELARGTGGSSTELESLPELVESLSLEPRRESEVRILPLWSTWPVFALVASLLVLEWILRKMVSLP